MISTACYSIKNNDYNWGLYTMLTKEQQYFVDNYEKIVTTELNKLDASIDYNTLRLLVRKHLLLITTNNSIISNLKYTLDALYDSLTIYKNFEKIKINFKVLLEFIKETILSNQNADFQEHEEMSLPQVKRRMWRKDNPKQVPVRLDASLKFIHGGGAMYIDRLLAGKVSGYSLEILPHEEAYRSDIRNSILGIQVTTLCFQQQMSSQSDLRAWQYAEKAMRYFFDYPCCFYGEIEAQYLDAAPNEYEAGIRNINLKHIKNPKIYIFAPEIKDQDFLSANLKHLFDPTKGIEIKIVSCRNELLSDFYLALPYYPKTDIDAKYAKKRPENSTEHRTSKRFKPG